MTTDDGESYEATKARLVEAEIERVRTERTKMRRLTRLEAAAHERGLNGALLGLVDHGDDDEAAVIVRLDQLRLELQKAADREVDERFRRHGRDPRGWHEPPARLNVNKMSAGEINKRWPQIMQQLRHGKRK